MHIRKYVLIAFFTILTLGLALPREAEAHSLLKRGGVDLVHHDESRFWLDVSVGGASLGEIGFDFDEPTLTVAPRWELRSRARHRLYLSTPVLWVPDADRRVPSAEARTDFGAEFDSSLFLMPSLEWLRCTDTCVRPAAFVGAGVRIDRVQATPAVIVGPDGSILGQAPTDELVNPVVTLGGSVQRPLKPRLDLRLEARLVTTFYDDSEVTNAFGGNADLGLDTEVELFVSVGLQFGF